MAWYKAGTVSVNNGNVVVIGNGTLFINNVKSGDIFIARDGLVYEIDRVASDTSLTLAKPYGGETANSVQYEVVPTTTYLKTLATQVTDLIALYEAVPQSAEDAQAAARAAETSATDAGKSAQDASASADRAEASSLGVSGAVTQVGQYSAEALTSMQAAQAARVDAETARDVVEASADLVSEGVDAAEQWATKAQASASDASAAKEAAAVSAMQAADVVTGLAESVETALATALQAGEDAAAASSKAGDANVAAESASSDAASAKTAAEAATAAAQTATETANGVDSKATEAQGAAVDAKAASEDAKTAAVDAKTAATQAAKDATAALAGLKDAMPRSGGDFTGPVTFNGQPPWDKGNLDPSNYVPVGGTVTYAQSALTLRNAANPEATAMVFNWSGQPGQPTYVWGSNDGANFYVWNPAGFNVSYANSAGSALYVNGVSSPATAGSQCHSTGVQVQSGFITPGQNATIDFGDPWVGQGLATQPANWVALRGTWLRNQ